MRNSCLSNKSSGFMVKSKRQKLPYCSKMPDGFGRFIVGVSSNAGEKNLQKIRLF